MRKPCFGLTGRSVLLIYRICVCVCLLFSVAAYIFAAPNSVPFNDLFETYASGSPLNGNNGWLAADTSVVATNAKAYAGTISAYISKAAGLTNQATIGTSNVWVDMYVQPHLMPPGAVAPVPDTNVVAQFYFNEFGYPVVLQGALTNWVTITNTVAVTAITNITTDAWVRVTMYMNYVDQKWALFVNDQMVKDDITFHTPDTSFSHFGIENETFLDNYWINYSMPTNGGVSNSLPTLAGDADQDGMADAWEINYFRVATTIYGSSDPDNDGRSNLEEFSTNSNPLVADFIIQILPFRDGFENAAVTNSLLAGWHGFTNVGASIVSSEYVEAGGTRSMMISNGVVSLDFASDDGTNVWVQIFSKPVFARPGVSPSIFKIHDVAQYYVTNGGVLWAQSAGTWQNLMSGIPENTWVGFAAHVDYGAEKWDLYVSTNAVPGNNMVRANTAGGLDFMSGFGSTSMTNITIEIGANTNMFVDVIAASYGYTNLVAAYSNVVAQDRLVGKTISLARPPYAYTNAAADDTLDGAMGVDLMRALGADDKIYIDYTNGIWNLFFLESGTTWQSDGVGMAAGDVHVQEATAMRVYKGTGRDTVVFYPYGDIIAPTNQYLIVGTNDVVKAGWNVYQSPFSMPRIANDPVVGFNFDSPAPGDRLYIGNHRLYYWGAPYNKWYEGSMPASNVLAPGEQFYYYRMNATSYYWTAVE